MAKHMKQVLLRQYREIVDRGGQTARELQWPKQGWIRTVREALGMSGAQLGRRLGVTRSSVSQAEKRELDGSITLKAMQEMAEAMGCRFVHAIVPETTVEALVEQQARYKASELLKRVNTQMALEAQSLSPERQCQELDRLTNELMSDMPRDLWDED